MQNKQLYFKWYKCIKWFLTFITFKVDVSKCTILMSSKYLSKIINIHPEKNCSYNIYLH